MEGQKMIELACHIQQTIAKTINQENIGFIAHLAK